MFQLLQVLKSLKKPLKNLNKDKFRDIHNQQEIHRERLQQVQKKLYMDP